MKNNSMKNKWMSRILMVATPMMIVCVVLALGASAVAQSDVRGAESRRCSNRTIFGDYGTQIEGTLLVPNWPLRTLAMIHFDGRGNMTSVDHVVLNGVPPVEEWRPNSGTYTVNPDCTGSAVFSGPIPVHFVVVNNGKEFRGVVDGDAITLMGSRVD
jgi:hypothetical protein